MDWTRYLNGIFFDLNITVYENEQIHVDIVYLNKLFQLLNQTSIRVIGIFNNILFKNSLIMTIDFRENVANYVHWLIVENTMEDTDEGLKSLDRETYCFFQMRLLESAIIPEYAKKFFPRDHRQEVSHRT